MLLNTLVFTLAYFNKVSQPDSFDGSINCHNMLISDICDTSSMLT